MSRFFLLLLVAGCTPAMLEDAPCPCASGYSCCQVMNVCLPTGSTACPGEMIRLERVEPTSAPLGGGVVLTLTGAGFERLESVEVGASSCETLRVVSDERLTCIAPPGPVTGGSVDIRAWTEDGEVSRLERAFFYAAPLFDTPYSTEFWNEDSGVGVGVIDVNSDGRQDLLMINSQGTDSQLYIQQAPFEFEDVTPPEWIDLGRNRGVTVADFTGDGKDDALIFPSLDLRRIQPAATLLEGWGDGFSPRDVPGLRVQDGAIRTAIGIDLDGDRDMDLVGAVQPDGAGPPLVVALNEDGELSEAPSWVHPSVALLEKVYSIATGDFDRDGDEDLAICGDELLLLENRGGLFFDITQAAGIVATLPKECWSVHAADFDADGDLDLSFLLGTVIREVSGTLLFRNDTAPGGPSLFRAAPRLGRSWLQPQCRFEEFVMMGASLDGGARNGVWLDYDFDSDLDLFLPYPSPQCSTKPLLYRSQVAQGRLEFLPELIVELPIFRGVTGIGFADLDQDGDLDFAFNEWSASRRALVRNRAVENAETSSGAALGKRLVVRVAAPSGALMSGLTVELDMDGPAGAPDFALGQGKLQTRVIGVPGRSSSSVREAWFGLGGHTGPVWARVRLADGTMLMEEVSPGVRELVLHAD